MNAFSETAVLQLPEGTTLSPFDTAAAEQQYILVLPDGRHFRLTPNMYQFVTCIDGQRTVAEIAGILEQKWGRAIPAEQVWQMAQRHLGNYGLLVGSDAAVSLPGRAGRIFSWRVDLFSPRRIAPLTRLGQYFFTWPVAIPSLFVIALAYLFVYADANAVWHQWAQSLGESDFILVYGLTILSVLWHEMGHASACRRFGEEYGTIGFGIYLIFPVFYADVTRIWRLTRWQRVVVDLGGIYFQLWAAVIYYLVYLLSGSRVFLLAVINISLIVLLAFNPLAKFDGYWIVSDALGVPNLHRRLWEMVKRLLGRQQGQIGMAFKPWVRIGLGIYLVWFVWLTATMVIEVGGNMPAFIQQLLTTLTTNIDGLLRGWQTTDGALIGAALLRLISPGITLLGLTLLLLRGLRALVKRVSVQRAPSVALPP
ncbi:MAG: M50 family metallopeptidase [Anaerolineales bacterium]|nr:M50 family metallopeptidase [Anaerolineales bacterium]MCB8952681.1 M50 family metallopeptidase [Ardenticatenales bacterium]